MSDKAETNEEWYNRNWNTRWNVPTPRRELPHRVRPLLFDVLLMLGQAIVGYTPVTDQRLTQHQRSITVYNALGSLSNVNASNINFRQVARSGGGVKEGWGRHWGAVGMHHILDPTQGKAGWSIIANDLIRCVFTAGTARLMFGFCEFNTVSDETSLVGAGFRTNNTDGYWTTFLRDGTGTPSTVLHETGVAAATSTVPRRLGVVLNAGAKTVDWYVDGTLVDSYAPTAALAQMTNVPKFGYYGVTNAAADASLQHFGGANPRVLSLLPVG